MQYLLEWDKTGEKTYELGCDRGVLYLQDDEGNYTTGEVWNGLITITESPGGAEATDMYADNIKYGSMRSAETFGATIEAYTYPPSFERCDGTVEVAPGVTIGQQSRVPFALSYRTMIGNDTATEKDDGYKIHLVYGATASPSEKTRSSVNDSPEAVTFSWEITTVATPVPGYKPTATMEIDSTKCSKEAIEAIENILYGIKSDDTTSSYSATPYSEEGENETEVTSPVEPTPGDVLPRLPQPAEIIEIMRKYPE